jgi:diguanylate cyclase (GGDEF)-like protein
MAKTILLMATRERNNVSMLMLDIDHLKKVNDSYGHQAGDSVLVNLAKRIKSFTREGDLFARVGGEEFAILLNNTSLVQAEVLAERIRSTVESMELPYNKWSIKVTISIGLSELNQDHTEIEHLYLKSDKNLYEAKIAGRNQCYPPKT